MEQLQIVLSGLLESAKPALLAFAYTLAAKYFVDLVGKFFGAGLDKIIELKAKINENDLMSRLQLDDFILDRLHLIASGVKDSMVDALKEASVDGKLTPDEVKKVSKAALDAFKASLTKEELFALLRVAGEDFMTLVAARLPGAVALSKSDDSEEVLYTDPS